MRSRAARLTVSAIALLALAAAAVFTFQTESQIRSRRELARHFNQRALDVERTIADIRAAQQAYVAAGQSANVWAPKVSTWTTEIANAVDALRASAASGAARAALMSAAATAIEIGNVDRRAREYLKDGQELMASDVLFTEAEGTTALAAGQLQAARIAETEELDALEAADRRTQAYALAAGGGLAGLLLILLGSSGSKLVQIETPATTTRPGADETGAEWRPAVPAHRAVQEDLPRRSAPLMKAAAELCTDLGRVNDPDDLVALLGKAAELMDASGLVVWLGSTGGAHLRAVVAHGYTPQALARMPAVPRQADNAAAAAYRTSALQIVLARPGASNGALAAPLLTPDGCIGALTAEIRGSSETSDLTQALAAIVAAQLASVLASSVASMAEHAPERVASA